MAAESLNEMLKSWHWIDTVLVVGMPLILAATFYAGRLIDSNKSVKMLKEYIHTWHSNELGDMDKDDLIRLYDKLDSNLECILKTKPNKPLIADASNLKKDVLKELRKYFGKMLESYYISNKKDIKAEEFFMEIEEAYNNPEKIMEKLRA